MSLDALPNKDICTRYHGSSRPGFAEHYTSRLCNMERGHYFAEQRSSICLHRVGAKRCPATMRDCNTGCKTGGNHNGKPIKPKKEDRKEEYPEIVGITNVIGDKLDTGSKIPFFWIQGMMLYMLS